MKSAVQDIGTLKKKITIEIPPETVDKELAKALSDIARKAKIHGFRPGKAPKAIVERHYGEEVKAEVMNRLISESYLRSLEEHKLRPADMPDIGDLSSFTKGTQFSFSVTVEVRPDIQLGVYDGIEVKELKIDVTDAEVNDMLGRLQEMYAQLEVVEGRPLEKTDTAVIDFEGFREGKSIEGAKAADHVLSLGTNSLIPGFEDQLIGMNKGETREIKVTFPADYGNKELAGQNADFRVTLKEVKKKVLPELNDEFAKDIGGDKSLEELKKGVKNDIEARKRSEQASGQREELMQKLIESHTFEVPAGMVERELQGMLRSHATRMARQGVDVKTLDLPKFREQQKPLAEQRVKGYLLLDVIGEREKIEVSDKELASALAAMARSSNKTLDEVKKYYDSAEGGLDSLRNSLEQEKTLNLLLSRAKKSYN